MVQGILLKTERRVNAKMRGKTIKVVREQYLRDDVSCHSPNCNSGCLEQQFGPKSFLLSKDATHYLIPCFDIVQNYLEVLEIPELTGVIFLQSVVTKVLRDVGKRHYERILSMTRGSQHGSVVFLNEIHKSTSITRKYGEPYSDWLTKCTYSAGVWYSNHLNNKIPIIVVTEEEEVKTELEKIPSNLTVMTFKDYLEIFYSSVKFAQELYDSISSSFSDDCDTDSTKTYMQYLPLETLEAGIRMGHFSTGYLFVNEHRASEEAFIKCSTVIGKKNADILVFGMIDRNRAIHGDEVVVELLPKSEWKSRGQSLRTKKEEESLLPRAKVVGVIQRKWRDFVATLPEEEDCITSVKNGRDRVLVIPYDYRIPKIRIVTKQADGLKNKRFVVRIDNWNIDSHYPNGHFVKSLGELGQLDTEVAAMLVEHGLSTQPFSNKVLSELPVSTSENTWHVDIKEVERRLDLRQSHLVFSIDPQGCEDVDDALSVRHLPDDCIELGVHIADVTHFVKPSSVIDLEAQSKATSIYLPDRRYDMLPPLLSANLCSLLGKEDRYAVSVIWQLDSNYEVKDVWYGRTVICSAYKMCYEAAQNILDGKSMADIPEVVPELKQLSFEELHERYTELKWALETLVRISRVIRRRRLENGGIELDNNKPHFEVDTSNSSCVGKIKCHAALEINKVVAECMIFANHWVAKKIATAFPTHSLLRKHPAPKKEDLKDLKALAKVKGLTISAESSKDLRVSLEHAVDLTDPSIIEVFRFVTTCALQQATYISTGSSLPDDNFHYGLGLDYYTHFTSPIRRYADILVHRLLLASVDVEMTADLYLNTELKRLCENINEKHLAAKHIEKVSAELYQSFYFQSKCLENEKLLADGVIYSLHDSGFMVYVPFYALKGPVHLLSKDNQVKVVSEEGTKWMEGRLVKSELTISVEYGSYQQTYGLLNHVTICIKVQPSRFHLPNITFDLVDNKPYNLVVQPDEKPLPEAVAASICDGDDVVKASDITEIPKVAQKSCSVESVEPKQSLYEILRNFRELTIKPVCS